MLQYLNKSNQHKVTLINSGVVQKIIGHLLNKKMKQNKNKHVSSSLDFTFKIPPTYFLAMNTSYSQQLFEVDLIINYSIFLTRVV